MNLSDFYHFLLYRISTRSKFDIHSPFVYKLYSEVLKDCTQYPGYVELKQRFPAAKPFKYYRLLYRLAMYLNHETIYFNGQEDGPAYTYFFDPLKSEALHHTQFDLPDLIDLAFIDLQYLGTPENGYFSKLLQHTNKDSVLIIWNLRAQGVSGNEWEEIREDPMVKVTIDLYHLGIVFFKEELSKEDFVLRF